MNLTKRIAYAAVFTWAVGTAGFARAGRLVLEPSSHLWITGDSTLHVWHSTATVLQADIDLSSAPKRAGADSFYEGVKAGEVRKFELHIPVDGLKSGKKMLDSNLCSTMNQKRYPEILFKLRDYRVETAGPELLKIWARGTLTVAGKEREVVLEAAGFPGADGTARVRGSYDLLMTDYGVKPPVLMMGTLKTADKVSVHYDLDLKFE